MVSSFNGLTPISARARPGGMSFESFYVTRLYLPDDRLAQITFNERGYVFAYRRWHIAPILVAQMGQLAYDCSEANLFELCLNWTGPPVVECGYGLSSLQRAPMEAHVRAGPPIEFEISLRRDLVCPAMVRELNEVTPLLAHILVPPVLLDV